MNIIKHFTAYKWISVRRHISGDFVRKQEVTVTW